MNGTLYLVGVGPGDPELLTIKALRVLKETGHIVFPRKPGQPSRALGIVEEHLNGAHQLFPLDLPMCIEREPAQRAYDEAARKIASFLQAGKDVAYLCEGDPLFYGSAMYLVARMANRAKIRVVPGVTSLNAAAAAIVRPLAARTDRLKVLPATTDTRVLEEELRATEAAAIIKVGRHLQRITKVLENTGHARNAMVIINASTSDQKIVPLSRFSESQPGYFAMILCYRGNEPWAE